MTSTPSTAEPLDKLQTVRPAVYADTHFIMYKQNSMEPLVAIEEYHCGKHFIVHYLLFITENRGYVKDT